jgi:hypothetical protein
MSALDVMDGARSRVFRKRCLDQVRFERRKRRQRRKLVVFPVYDDNGDAESFAF